MSKYQSPRFADQIMYRAKCFECPNCEGWNDAMGQFDCRYGECVGQLRRVLINSSLYELARELEATNMQSLVDLASMREWGELRSSKAYRAALKTIQLFHANTKRIAPGATCQLYEGQILDWWIDKETKELVLRYREGRFSNEQT